MQAYYDTIYDIPSECQNRLLPNNIMNVLDFIQLELPKTSSAILTYPAKTLILNESPTEDIQCLTSCNLPSKTFIDNAKAVSGQAMLDGAMSIEDPQYKGGHLPLWTILFWARMHAICKEQQIWKQSEKWLAANVDNSARMTAINECWMVLGSLPWNELLPHDLGTTRVNHLLPLTYDSESEGKLTLKKLAANIPLLPNRKYYGFVIVNDTVMFAKGKYIHNYRIMC